MILLALELVQISINIRCFNNQVKGLIDKKNYGSMDYKSKPKKIKMINLDNHHKYRTRMQFLVNMKSFQTRKIVTNKRKLEVFQKLGEAHCILQFISHISKKNNQLNNNKKRSKKTKKWRMKT